MELCAPSFSCRGHARQFGSRVHCRAGNRYADVGRDALCDRGVRTSDAVPGRACAHGGTRAAARDMVVGGVRPSGVVKAQTGRRERGCDAYQSDGGRSGLASVITSPEALEASSHLGLTGPQNRSGLRRRGLLGPMVASFRWREHQSA